MRAILPSIATLAILCAACSDTPASPASDANREAVASVVGGVTYPLVSITPAVASLKLQDTTSVKVVLTDSHGKWLGKYITWKSSDPTVISVTVTGTGSAGGAVAHLKALKNGSASITATTQSSTSATKLVAVGTVSGTDAAVAKVTVTPNWTKLASGKTFQLAAAAYDVKGAKLTAAKITWRSTNAKILSVTSTGMVKALSKGQANAEAVAMNGKLGWSTIIDTGGVAVPPVTTPGSGAGVPAVWSDNFVASVGVATHFSYFDLLPYNSNVNSTIAAIKNAGFRFVRDGLSVQRDAGWNNRYWGALKSVTQQGLKVVLITQPGVGVGYPYTNQSNLDTAVARLGASNILAFEGPNEVDNNSGNWGGVPAFGTNARTYQAAMYRHAKQIAPSVPVIGLTTTTATGANYVGDISAYMDDATMHPYPIGGIPDADLQGMETSLSALNGARKAWWVTESGYHTAPGATKLVYQPGVSEAAQGKYIPRLYLDYFKAGIKRTSVYEIIDERSDASNAEMNFGLLRNNGTPKPAYTALKNMLGVLADPGGAFTPTKLGYSLAGATSTVRQLLFQKRDGRFYLVLWNDVPVYDTRAKRDVASAAVTMAVTLAVKPRAVSRYQPYVSAAGTSVTPSTTIAVTVPDNPVILEITP